MLYRKMEKTGDELSILGFGCMRLPTKNGRIDEALATKQLRHAIDQGVNYVDTAWPYHGGRSESFLGKALKDGYREKVKIATKLPQFLCHSKDDMYSFFNKQLVKLDTDKIDYYLIHSLNGAGWEKMKELGIFEFMEDIKSSGKVTNIGFSFHGVREDFKTIVDDYNWDFCQIQYNILDEHNQAGKEGLMYAAEKGLGVIIMEPLHGGSLATTQPDKVKKIYDSAKVKRTNVEWALRWIWNHPEVTVVLSGMNNDDHIRENIEIASKAYPNSLTELELKIVSDAANTYKSLRKVGCTGCGYCMPCPAKVNIPGAFEAYNNRHLFNKKLFYTATYLGGAGGLMGGDTSLASQCINCKKCVKECPQSINIPEELKNVSREFEGPINKSLLFLGKKYMGLQARRKKKRSS
ncbi:aldo/keto reductase [Wukongibacter baidiensis]|uniref:aldo/keto reductase n=1 Tax=Wukongibacter baidiensis TaxID=1723361 RepID=UPI003D7F2F69